MVRREKDYPALIKTVREQLELSQEDLAREIGVSYATVNRWENGAPGGSWGPMYGELLTFDDPETRLPAIDLLESFLLDRPSIYTRVLVLAIIHGGAVPAWFYVGLAPFYRPRTLPQDFWSG